MAQVSNVQEALKYSYGASKVAYLMNQEIVLFNILSKMKKQVGGRGQFIIPLWVNNPGAFTGIVEGGALPTPLQPDTTEATFALQEYVASYDVTWKLIQDARSDKFAFQRAIQMLDEGLKRRVMRNLNSDLLGSGKGELGVLPAADDQTTITLNAVPRMEVGMVVDVMDASDDDTKLEDSATVTAVDPINKTVTLSGAPAGTAAGDYIVIQDSTDDSINDSLHTFGILGVIDDADPAAIVGDFGNVDRGTAGNEFSGHDLLLMGKERGHEMCPSSDLQLQLRTIWNRLEHYRDNTLIGIIQRATKLKTQGITPSKSSALD